MCRRRTSVRGLGLYVELSPMERAGMFAASLQPMGITRSWAEKPPEFKCWLKFSFFFSFFWPHSTREVP